MVTIKNKLIFGALISVLAIPSVANDNKQSGIPERVTNIETVNTEQDSAIAEIESQISELPDYSNEIADLESRVTDLENADNSSGTNDKVMKYIGQTVATTLMKNSVVEKNALCVAEYGGFNPPSKMSTSEELMRSIDDDTYKNNPINGAVLLRSTKGVNGATIDYSGLEYGDCMNSIDEYGIIFYGSDNRFSRSICGNQNPVSVACSAPQ